MCTGGSPSSNGSQEGDSAEAEQQQEQPLQPSEQSLRTAVDASTSDEILAEYGENLKLLTLNSQVAELLTIIRDKYVAPLIHYDRHKCKIIVHSQKYVAKRFQILCRPANPAGNRGIPKPTTIHRLWRRDAHRRNLRGSEISLWQLWRLHYPLGRSDGARFAWLLPLHTHWKDSGWIGCQYTWGTRRLCTFSRRHR